MKRVRPGWTCMLSLLALAVAPAALAAQKPPPVDVLTATVVSDLHYGDVLFNYYAGDEFNALTRLNAYHQWGRLPNHQADAALLAGGLELQLGLGDVAGEHFETLLTSQVPEGVRNRAWFYLANVWYERGVYPKAEQALGHITGALTPQLEARRQHLLINVLMRQERFAEAVARLHDWQGPADWMAYARFNLGVALVRQGRLQEAAPILGDVGTLAPEDPELVALKDKANLALGYAWLQAGNPYAARNALNRVRLTGPYATRALLGVGWANSAIHDHKAALTPWLELYERDPLDAAVQESYLAVPYAMVRLGAKAQAVAYYEAAITAFSAESARIDEAVQRIGGGHLLEDLLGAEHKDAPGIDWRLARLPDAPQYRYLYTLLADNAFQEGLRNYRDLTWFDGTLEHWCADLEALGEMADTRKLALAKSLPQADALLATSRAQRLLGDRAELDAALNAAEKDGNAIAFGTVQERGQWSRIRALDAVLQAAPPASATDEARDKLRLIRGALQWKLEASFPERDYAARSELRALHAALNEAQVRWSRLQRARESVDPQAASAMTGRIVALNEQLSALRSGITAAKDRQDRALAQIAQAQLLAQRERLSTYTMQARFALADLYDRAVSDMQPDRPAGVSTPAAAPAAGARAPGAP